MRRWCTRRTARTCSTAASSCGDRSRRHSRKPSTGSPSARSGAAAPPCRSRPSASPRSGTRGPESSTSGPRSRCPSSPIRRPARCGPYAIPAIEYDPISLMTNKTPQEAVRGFGQSPTNFAIERAIDRVARHLGMDRIELRKRNFIRKDQFPYTIPSGSTYDSGDYHAALDRALAAIDYPSLVRARDEARRSGRLAGFGITTWMESCLVRVDLSGAITGVINNSSSGQGHESLVSTVLGEILERDPASIRVVRADSLT